jgi:hypothetical protein
VYSCQMPGMEGAAKATEYLKHLLQCPDESSVLGRATDRDPRKFWEIVTGAWTNNDTFFQQSLNNLMGIWANLHQDKIGMALDAEQPQPFEFTV